MSVQDNEIDQAISDAANAQATADGKIVTFRQTTAPTAEGTGDIWIDSDDNNKPYRWDGAAWVAQDWDGGIWAKITGSGKPEDSATVGAQLGTNLKDSGGTVRGDADFLASFNKLTSTNIGSYFDTAAILSAYIGTAEIKTANIDDLNVTTLKIADNAVTIASGAYTEAETGVLPATSFDTIQSVTFTSSGNPVSIFWSSGINHPSGAGDVIFRIYRDSTQIYTSGTVDITGTTADLRKIFSATIQDTPPSGSVTYELRASSETEAHTADQRSLVAIETKK